MRTPSRCPHLNRRDGVCDWGADRLSTSTLTICSHRRWTRQHHTASEHQIGRSMARCAWYNISLARHTPQSEGKRGLVTMRTSCSGDQNWSRPIRFEIWVYCLATLYWRRARNAVGPALFAVIRDVFCNYCILTEQLAVRMVTRPSFSWDWRVWLVRLV